MPADEEKAADRAERLLIEAIMNGTYQPGTFLPGERNLCKDLGVARPALREALQRLSRDGWLTITQGKPTIVTDYLREGNLNMLSSLLSSQESTLIGFVPDLLEMWGLLAPTYTRRAVERESAAIARLLFGLQGVDDRPEPVARAQWRLHRTLTELCGNPIYGLVLNSFAEFYRRLAIGFFAAEGARARVRAFWTQMELAARAGDGPTAAALMEEQMAFLRDHWDAYVDLDTFR